MEAGERDADHGRSLIGLAVGLSIVLVAIAAALLFALDRHEADDRTLAEVAELHLLEPTAPPPRDRARGPRRRPPATGDGLPPPDLPPPAGPAGRQPPASAPAGVTGRILEQGWRPIGLRSDEVDGYAVETAIYVRDGERLGHSLVVGAPDPPDDARRLGRRGVLLRSFDQGAVVVVAWGGDDVSEILAGVGRPRDSLYDLAAGPA